MYVCTYVRTYVCMHACMHACMYVRMYVCVYLSLSLYIYIYIYTYTYNTIVDALCIMHYALRMAYDVRHNYVRCMTCDMSQITDHVPLQFIHIPVTHAYTCGTTRGMSYTRYDMCSMMLCCGPSYE